MNKEKINPEVTQGNINALTTFFKKWFIEIPKAVWNHIVRNFWLYITIIGLTIGGYFFNVLIGLTGSWQNASWTLFGITSLTGVLWLWKIDAVATTFRHIKMYLKWYFLATAIFLLALYIFEGAFIHEYIMKLREYSFVVFFIPVIIFSFKWLIKKETDTWLGKTVVVSLAFIVTGTIASYLYFGGQQYLAQYFKYNELKDKIVYLDNRPESVSERVFPRDVYRSILDQMIKGTNQFSNPDLVMDHGRAKFYSTVAPLTKISKFIKGEIPEVAEIPADDANIPSNITMRVSFSVGEKMPWSRDINNYVVKSLYWRYFNVFPTNTQVMKNDKGKFVLVTSLARWKGYFFPTPEFYGVAITEQGNIDWPTRVLFGKAEIIKKDEFKSHKWLLGQNLNSEISTRYAAESLRFRNGFLAPLTHDGDVIVTDMPGDRNEFPLVTAFDINGTKKLYDFYELKSYKKKSGKADLYIFFPSDGQGNVYSYLSKATTISELSNKVSKEIESNSKNKFKFAEPRPFFKKGLPDLFIVSMVLKRSDGSFDPSGIKTYLINADGVKNSYIEVPTYEKDKWETMARKAFSH